MNTLRKFLFRTILCLSTLLTIPLAHAEQVSIDELAEALLSQMSPAEQEQLLRETEELFKSLSPEELMELGRASEDFLREELKKEGLDLLPVEQPPTEPQPSPEAEAPTAPALEQPVEREVDFDQPLVQIDSKLLDRAKAILNDIVDMISDIEQRSLEQRSYKQQLSTIMADVNLLVSMFNIVNHHKLVRYFADDEHKAVFEHIVTLYNKLNHHIDAFKPEPPLEGENPYHALGLPTGASLEQVKKQYSTLTRDYDPERIRERLEKQDTDKETIKTKVAKARKRFNEVVNSFQQIQTQIATEKAFQALYQALRQAVYTNNISQGLKDILEAHAPEALKQTEEAEKRAETARKAQETAARQYPPYSPMVFEPRPQQPRFTPEEYARMYGRPSAPTPSPAPAAPKPIKPTKPEKDKDKDKEKKKEDKGPTKTKEDLIRGEKTFYQALSIPGNAGLSQIRQAYADKKKLYVKGDTDALKDWSIINDAYDILQDPHLRKIYDAYLKEYLPKEAREKIKEYKKSMAERRKKEEELEKKVKEVAPEEISTAAQARDLFAKQLNTGLAAASNQLRLHASNLEDFKDFLTTAYDPTNLQDIIATKNALVSATQQLDAAIKAINRALANEFLEKDSAELKRFKQQATSDINQFMTSNATAIAQLERRTLTSFGTKEKPESKEKLYILLGIPYTPAGPEAAMQPGGLAGAAIETLLPPAIKDANPKRTNYVAQFVNKIRTLQQKLADELQPAVKK